MPGVLYSLLLVIVGATARYAFSDSVVSWTTGDNVQSLEIDTVGMILLIAGVVGLVFSVFWAYMSRNSSDNTDEPVEPARRPRKKS